jgi:folate-binding protein YgfZ
MSNRMESPLESLRAGKTCVNLSSHCRWRVHGADAERFLNGQLTQKIEGLEEGQHCHAAVCTAKGKLEGDLYVSNTEDGYYLDWVPSLGEALKNRLEKYVVTDDVEFSPISGKLFFIAGNELPELHLGTRKIRSTRYGLAGHDLWLPEGAIPPVLVANAETWDEHRVLEGHPLALIDYTHDHLAAEIFNEGTTLHYQKGCYVGQEVLNRIRTIGKVNRRLLPLIGKPEFNGKFPQILKCGDKEAGSITSAIKDPAHDRFIGLGVIRLDCAPEPLVDGLGNTWHARENGP